MSSQVNITLLDINDNHPTWKDAPYYINLVEMTPPDSDVTTVSGGRRAELQGCPSKGVCHPAMGSARMGLMDLISVSASSWSRVPEALLHDESER